MGLRLALDTGNFLNFGGYAGSAVGFKISSLAKLIEVRANKPRMTLLHFLVERADKEHKEILSFANELNPVLSKCERVSIEEMKNEFNTLNRNIQKLDKDLQKSDEQLQNQFKEFIKESSEEIEDLKKKLDEIDNLSTSLAEMFVEEDKKFKVEDMIGIFSTFCTSILKCREENKQRHILEEKSKKRKESQEKEKMAKLQAKSSLEEYEANDKKECIIDNLLNEVRNGFPLRKTVKTKNTSHPQPIRRKSLALLQNELNYLSSDATI